MKGRTMTRKSILIAGILLCLVGMLALPAAAAVATKGESTVLGEGAIDPELKNELWGIHMQHRLDSYERNVKAAGDAIEALGQYDYDTSALSDTLTEISAKHDALEAALNDRDRDELKSINADLRHLWKEYRQEFRQLLKGQ
jgi:hypothetical protein